MQSDFHEWRADHLSFSRKLIDCCDQLSVMTSEQQTELSDEIYEEGKRLALQLSKVTKKYDKQQDLQVYWDPDEICDKKHNLLHKTIMEYLIRQGNFKVVDLLVKELGLGSNVDIVKLQGYFSDLDSILKAYKRRNINPALEWAIKQENGTLCFKLHKLKYLQILGGEIDYPLNIQAKGTNATRALSYARDFLSPYFNEHGAEIKRLATCVIYSDLMGTPYEEFADPTLWDSVEKLFTSEFCLFVGLAPSSPLFVSSLVGTSALPIITKMCTLMKDKRAEWSQANELPVEIPISDEHRYHSLFVCPVSKEQATKENPAMLLKCGHMLCKESMHTLAKTSTKLKCPYCPILTKLDDALELFFE